MSTTIRVSQQVLTRMLAAARQNPAEECCGLLAGRDSVITAMFPAANALAAATQYEIAPQELFRIVRQIRAAGLELLGVYHSHPRSANQPSARDVERAYYPDAAYFIISPQPGASQPVRAFSIRDGSITELMIVPV